MSTIVFVLLLIDFMSVCHTLAFSVVLYADICSVLHAVAFSHCNLSCFYCNSLSLQVFCLFVLAFPHWTVFFIKMLFFLLVKFHFLTLAFPCIDIYNTFARSPLLSLILLYIGMM